MLAEQFDSMKAYAEAEWRVTSKRSFLRHRQYLWDNNAFQYGDWCAPGEGFMQWKAKGRYTSTAFMLNSVNILQQSAEALGKMEDAAMFAERAEKIKTAFAAHCVLPNGRLTGDFQTNYAVTLYFGLAPEEARPLLAKRLAELVRANGYKIATGFAGTPYILFALADNGYAEDAYRLLLNENCPGWLYTVKAGATTMWERWNALDCSGNIRADSIPDMVSFNHYAYGSVGAFFYRRILGIEALEPGYQSFRVAPLPGGGLTHAEGKIGEIAVSWRIENGTFSLDVTVPEGKAAEIRLPSGEKEIIKCGEYHFEEVTQ